MSNRINLQLTVQQIRLLISAIDEAKRHQRFPDRYALMEYRLLEEYLEYLLSTAGSSQ